MPILDEIHAKLHAHYADSRADYRYLFVSPDARNKLFAETEGGMYIEHKEMQRTTLHTEYVSVQIVIDLDLPPGTWRLK